MNQKNHSKKIIVNGKEFFTKKRTIMEALDEIGLEVPRLCKHEDLLPLGTCRLCIVEANNKIVTSCNTEVKDNMIINTDTEQVVRDRVNNLKLILSNHPLECLTCFRNGSCELQQLADNFNIPDLFDGEKRHYKIDKSSPSIIRDLNKCVLCGRCVEVCDSQGIHAIDYTKRGFETTITTPYEIKISESGCISCGQCVLHCPTAALQEKDDRIPVIKILENKSKYVIAQIAPSVRVSMSEEFGLKPGINLEKQIVTALKNIGFNAVLDTSLGADFTVMEEAYELVNRIKENKLPMFTSCCPAWVNYVEMHDPSLIKNLSTCKSPHEMLGALIKSYYAMKNNINPRNLVVVSIMPCTAKKDEIKNTKLKNDNMPNVDYVLTTREIVKIFKEYGLDLPHLKKTEFDLLDIGSSSAGKIFGRSGGVMEAALRTASFYLGQRNPKIVYKKLRGLKGIKTTVIKIKDKTIRVAVVNGMGNFVKNRDRIYSNYDFIEVMACPGGCIGGGGQPQPHSMKKVKLRQKGLNSIDSHSKVRLAHKNRIVNKIYKQFLIKPGSDIAEEYLHTSYKNKTRIVKD